MRIDLYTKGVLTVIAVLLAVIAVRQCVSTDAVVQAQGSFAGLQYSHGGSGEYFFDSRTGELWWYPGTGGSLGSKFRLTKLGAPLVREK